jgi:hypothetical protein
MLPTVPSELMADLISETPVNVSECIIGTNDGLRCHGIIAVPEQVTYNYLYIEFSELNGPFIEFSELVGA